MRPNTIIKAPRRFVADPEFELLVFLSDEMRRALDSKFVPNDATWSWEILRPTDGNRENGVVPFRSIGGWVSSTIDTKRPLMPESTETKMETVSP